MRYKLIGFKHYINTLCTEEGIFFTAFIVYLGRGVWETTMLPFDPRINQICLLLTIFFMGMKIIFYDTYSTSGYIGLAIGFSGTILIYMNSGYTNPFFWFLILLGCKNISFEKILKIYLVVVGSIMILALSAALLGVIENLIYENEGRGIRIAFGSVYVTDFASHIFYMILAYCYLKANHLKFCHYACIIIITGLIYYFCKTRLDCVSMLLIVIVFCINGWLQRLPYDGMRLFYKWRSFWKWLGLGSIPFMSVISLMTTAFYGEDNQFLVKINRLISSRLLLGKNGLDHYPIKLWGQTVDMIGAGGTTEWPVDYFFIDCSYIHILLRFGLVFSIAIMIVYFMCCYKCKNDIYFLIVIVLISLNCVVAHHLIDIAFNPFASVFLAYRVKRDYI